MEFVFLRHGMSKTQKEEGVICGAYDTPLADEGILEAKMLEGNTHLHNLDGVFCSDLSRAIETAKYAVPNHKPIITPLLRERSLGVFEGKKEVEVLRQYSLSKEALKTMRHSFGPERAPGGENYSDVLVKRVKKLFSQFYFHSDKKFAFVSHNCIIRCMLMELCKLEQNDKIFKLHIPNCRPIVLDYNKRHNKFELITPTWDDLISL